MFIYSYKFCYPQLVHSFFLVHALSPEFWGQSPEIFELTFRWVCMGGWQVCDCQNYNIKLIFDDLTFLPTPCILMYNLLQHVCILFMTHPPPCLSVMPCYAMLCYD